MATRNESAGEVVLAMADERRSSSSSKLRNGTMKQAQHLQMGKYGGVETQKPGLPCSIPLSIIEFPKHLFKEDNLI
jgi:hypothetical protein